MSPFICRVHVLYERGEKWWSVVGRSRRVSNVSVFVIGEGNIPRQRDKSRLYGCGTQNGLRPSTVFGLDWLYLSFSTATVSTSAECNFRPILNTPLM